MHETSPPQTPTRTPYRRALLKGAAWSIPVAVASTAAPALALSNPQCSPSTFSYEGVADGVDPAFNLTPEVRVVPTVVSETGSVPTYNGKKINGSVGHVVYQRTTTTSSAPSNLGNTTKNNLLLNIGASGSTRLRLDFVSPSASKPVNAYNVTLRIRDLTRTANAVDSVRFTPAATRYINVTNSSVAISSPPSALERSAVGNNEGSNLYYDADVVFAGPVQSITIDYSNASATPTEYAAIGIYSIAGC